MLLAAAIHLAAYWPGLMHIDATFQYDQALSGRMDDWHPVLMSWLWRRLSRVWPGPAPLFLLQSALYWGGYGLLMLWALRQKRTGLALGILASALMPMSVARLGSIIKDCLMAGALITAAGAGALLHQRKTMGRRAGGIAAVLFATALRRNAFLASFPFMLMLLPAKWREGPVRLAVAGAIAGAALFCVVPVTNSVLKAKPSNVMLSLIIFDLGGITEYSGVNMFPPMNVADPVAVNNRCYTARQWDGYGWWSRPLCPINFFRVKAAIERSGQPPLWIWLHAIATHPIAYAEHRIAHFNLNIRFISLGRIRQPIWNRSRTHYAEFAKSPNLILSAFNFAGSRQAESPLGWPVTAMALAGSVLLLGRGLRSYAVAAPLAWSSLLYGVGFLPLGVAAELRYHMWTTMAGITAAIIAAFDLYDGSQVSRRRVLLAFAPSIIIIAIAIVARLILTPDMIAKV